MKSFQQDVPCITHGEWIRVWAGLDPWDRNRPIVEVQRIRTKDTGFSPAHQLSPTSAKRLADTIQDAVNHLVKETRR